MTYHWSEPYNQTGEVHPSVDPFHILHNLKNHFACCCCCLPTPMTLASGGSRFFVGIQDFTTSRTEPLMDGDRLLSTLLSFMLPIVLLTNEV